MPREQGPDSNPRKESEGCGKVSGRGLGLSQGQCGEATGPLPDLSAGPLPVFEAPSTAPPPRLPSPSSRGEADELAARGADGDASTTSAAWGRQRVGRGAAEAGRVSSAGRWQGPGVATLIRCFPGEPGLPEPWRAVPGRVGGGPPLPSASLGPAYLGAGQQPQSTGRSWTQSRRAGAGPRGADRPRLGCWLGGGYLGTGGWGEGSDGEGPRGRVAHRLS